MAAEWTTLADVRTRLRIRWDGGEFLRRWAEQTSPFELVVVPIRAPSTAEMSVRFDDAREWVAALGVGGLVRRFGQLRADTAADEPGLLGWMARRPQRVLENADRWPALVRAGRRTGARPCQPCAPPSQFARRYGFAVKPTTVRFRSLDPRRPLYPGVAEVSVRSDEVAAAAPDAGTALVVENEVTYLACPDVPDSVVLIGGGFAASSLAALRWLQTRRVVYWGGIDTHGLVALDRLRALVPHTESLLMDGASLLAHRGQWAKSSRRRRCRTTSLRVSIAR